MQSDLELADLCQKQKSVEYHKKQHKQMYGQHCAHQRVCGLAAPRKA